MRSILRASRRLLLPLAAALLAAGLAGCGCCDGDDDYWGHIFVDNLTDGSTNEFVLNFQVAAFGQPWTGNLLSGDLPPGFTEFVGTFHEDYYDAVADLELGDFVEWFDVFVGCGEDVYFEIY